VFKAIKSLFVKKVNKMQIKLTIISMILVPCLCFAESKTEQKKEIPAAIQKVIQQLPTELQEKARHGAENLKRKQFSDERIVEIIQHIADAPRRLQCGKPYCFY
jgi:hypothetical protein